MATQPSILVRTRTGEELLGLHSVLLNAHAIETLAVPIPPAASGLWRLLAAITARITSLDQPDTPLEAWLKRRAELLETPTGFDPDIIDTYCAAHTWDLFDRTRPFLQDPALASQCAKTSGINTLVWGRPAGNNLAWFSAHTDTRPQPAPSHEAFWHLLIHHYYGRSGTCSTRTLTPPAPKHLQLRAGPVRGTVSFHPVGRTLYESLLLHLVPYQGSGQLADTDRCPWEEAPPDPHTPPTEVTWPGRLLAGRSRHALLLVPDRDGSHVTDVYLSFASRHIPPPAADPYTIIHTNRDKSADKRDTPRRADADRAMWRDLDALLLTDDETTNTHTSTRRPAAFDHLNDLPAPVRTHLRVQVHGFDQDPKTKDRTWYSALTPPIWNWAQEHDPDTATRIAECRRAAETLAATLRSTANQAWKQTTNAPRARPCTWSRTALALYWPRAEPLFWHLIEDREPDAFTAFAHLAITALRTATRTDLLHHQGAGPALAQAVAKLRATQSDRSKDR
ncbi:type I-E CRISPR-associated protein Cse1/CasA [Streptomyces sp. CB01635]|uniref:type I-E CRISPR-associated protein Cse1/CasA n=1 Tax=unclassified Streptomyces TaxID=2593676 RepID=UPI000C26DC65|nr:type I-E CRISPR-associated protein Cse1/CasA [Streptomyces sp. CB01635]PJN06094.1 type I-E CRISPR-associated protein Cse1/CasA [Streptomyces sp. CB01635]